MAKILSRNELFAVADKFEVFRYEDGRIDKIRAFAKEKKIHEAQAIYKTINGLVRLVGATGYLFPEIWNSLEVDEKAWYDRNPSSIFRSYVNPLANHAATTRWTYTVPTNRKAYVELAQIYIQKALANTAFTSARGVLNYVPFGGSNAELMVTYLYTNVQGDKDQNAIGQSILLNEGDVITYQTTVTCTAGEAYTILGGFLKATEFDA